MEVNPSIEIPAQSVKETSLSAVAISRQGWGGGGWDRGKSTRLIIIVKWFEHGPIKNIGGGDDVSSTSPPPPPNDVLDKGIRHNIHEKIELVHCYRVSKHDVPWTPRKSVRKNPSTAHVPGHTWRK